MRKTIMAALTVITTGCAAQYIPPQATTNSAHLDFELLTSSGAGGGGLLIGTMDECVADQQVSRFFLGHHFADDLSKFSTQIPSGKSVTLKAGVRNTIAYSCNHTIVFAPKNGARYHTTFHYNSAGCELALYEVNGDGKFHKLSPQRCK